MTRRLHRSCKSSTLFDSVVPKPNPSLVGFAKGDSIYSVWDVRSRGDVWFCGVIQKVPTGRRKGYEVEYEDGDYQYSVLPCSLMTKLPKSGIAFDGGNFSNIVNGVIVPDEEDDVPDPSVFSLSSPSSVVVMPPSLSVSEPLAPGLPSIDEIIGKLSPTLKHIPFGCRADFGRALNSLIDEILFHNDAFAWTSYFMFVPCVLLPYARGGSKHRKAVEKHTKERIQAWKGSSVLDYESRVRARVRMWRDLPISVASSPSDPVRRCKSLASEGRYALACRALADAESFAPSSNQTFEILSSKHPQAPPVDPFPYGAHASVSIDDIRFALSSFPAGSGAGPSRLSSDHIKEAAISYLQSSVFDKICKLANLFVAGKVLPSIQSYIAGASLSPLLKKVGGIRPIACGDVFRRIVAKCLVRQVKEKARSYFSPYQSGVAVPFGAEISIHSWREVIANFAYKDSSLVALKVDLVNAFNNVDRRTMLDRAHHHFPELFNFVSYCYANPSRLFVRGFDKVIWSSQGAQQGDPLAPLLSCLVFQVVIERINQVEGIKLNSWYMDDGGIVGEPATIFRVLSIFDELSSKLGVHLNKSKSEIIFLGNVPDVNPFGEFGFKITDISSLEMLGSPLGSPVFCDSYVLDKAIVKSEALIEKLHLLENPQIAYLLLRSCLSYCKMIYYMRTVPVGSMSSASSRFDTMMINCLAKLIGYKIDKPASVQTSLNISNGGLGIRNVSFHHPAAFFSSIRSCLSSVSQVCGLPGILSTKLMLNAQQALVPSVLPELFSLRSQSAISAAIDKVMANRLFASSSAIDRARLLSSASPHAGDFLLCPPISRLGLQFSALEWSTAVAYKLGLKFLPSPTPCINCNLMVDVQARHAVRCADGDRIRRHNQVRNFLFNECKAALVAPILEPPNLIRNSELRPADFGIPDYRPGQFMAYDVAITDPTQDAYVSIASVSASSCAESYASNVKIPKYSDALDSDDSLLFTPLICESYGAWNSAALGFFNELSSWLSARNPCSSFSVIRSRLFQKVSSIIQRANARMILARIQNYNFRF